MKTYKAINLLPPWVQIKKRNRIIAITLATFQVAIFLSIGFSFFILNTLQQRNIEVAASFSHQLQLANPAWEYKYNQANEVLHNMLQLDSFLRDNTTYSFETKWFTYIINTMPYGTNILHMAYFNGETTVTVETYNIAIAEIHRRNLVNTELFYNVSLGRINFIREGVYSYEILIYK